MMMTPQVFAMVEWVALANKKKYDASMIFHVCIFFYLEDNYAIITYHSKIDNIKSKEHRFIQN